MNNQIKELNKLRTNFNSFAKCKMKSLFNIINKRKVN